MKLFVKLVFYCNFLFWGGGFLLAFLQYIAYNGFGDIFEYVKPEYLETRVEIDSITETKTIIYKYTIDKKTMNQSSLFTYQELLLVIFMKAMCIIISKYLA